MSPDTRRKILGFLGALPVAFWAVLALVGGLIFAFLGGKARGRQDEKLSRQDDEAAARIKGLKEAGGRGDDAEAQRRIFEGIKGRR